MCVFVLFNNLDDDDGFTSIFVLFKGSIFR